nr:gustatory receptor 31 [Papilio machaon]
MLDKEFVSIFALMHFISTCLFIRKYNLYKNQVISSSKRGILFAVIGIIIVFSLLILTLNNLPIIFNTTTYYTYMFIYVQYAVGCSVIIILNLYHSISHKKLLVTLQKIERYLPDRRAIKRIKIIVWISCFTLILSHSIFITLKLIFDPFWTKEKGCFVILTLILDFELFYSTIVVHLMACKMKQWTQLLNKNNKQSSNRNRISEHNLKMMYKTYKYLLHALTLVRRSTQWTILLHFVTSFTQSMAFFGVLMLCTGNEVMNSMLMTNRILGIATFVMKSLTMETIYCMVCENFYRQTNSAKVAVILFGNDQEYSSAKRFAKIIQRLNSLQYQKLTGCGVFVVDAKLPLHLGALILNHTVVLLQIALSKIRENEDG